MEILIPGDLKEGGGQVLRIAASLASVLQKRVKIVKIRANRKNGGLAAQHLTGLQLLAEICGANIDNLVLKSTSITFRPNSSVKPHATNFSADTKTAGSTALLLQVALPSCLYRGNSTHLVLKGGTNAPLAPSIDYVIDVLKPNLKRLGINIDIDVARRGFFPVGGGQVECIIPPIEKLIPIILTDFGELLTISVTTYYSTKKCHEAAEECLNAAQRIFTKKLSGSVKIEAAVRFLSSPRGAWGINMKAETSSGCILGAGFCGETGNSPTSVGEAAAEELLESLLIKACVDKHMQDQLIVFMALADGKSRIRIGTPTLHTETAIEITKLLCEAKIQITPDGEGFILECDGIGCINKF